MGLWRLSAFLGLELRRPLKVGCRLCRCVTGHGMPMLMACERKQSSCMAQHIGGCWLPGSQLDVAVFDLYNMLCTVNQVQPDMKHMGFWPTSLWQSRDELCLLGQGQMERHLYR